MKDTITMKGERSLWIEFTHTLKKQKRKVWDTLKPFLEDYIKRSK